MEKLKLPISKDFPEANGWLSMDDYIEFVNFNSKYFRPGKRTKKDKLYMPVNVPFSLK